jgi:hypothetical protein
MPSALLTGLAVGWAGAVAAPDVEGVSPRQDLKPGLVYVFFDDGGFQRPGNHGRAAGIKSHGVVTEIKSHGVDERIDLQIEGIEGFSQLWIGEIRLPVNGEITFSADADDGLRLKIGDRWVIDGWGPDRAREGRIEAVAGRTLPIRVEYFQAGGESYLRLHWEWEGHPRELLSPSAFRHGPKDRQTARAIVEGRQAVTPGAGPRVVSAPAGDEEWNSSIYRPGRKERAGPGEPVRLGAGPHLFVDDLLIDRSTNVKRRVNRPRRDPSIPNPIITGKEDHCVAPYMTVVRDAGTGRFRIWYNVYKEKHKDGTARFAYMESEDGIRWIRPHRVLEEPGPIQFGCSVIDEGPGFAEPERRFKLAWWNAGGLMIAASADGLRWSMLKPYPVVRHNHDINNVFHDAVRDRYVATISVYIPGPDWSGLRRTTMQTASRDLIDWEKPWYVLSADDRVDEGQTQFYAMNGYLRRGGLLIGLVKVLHDDWTAPETPDGAFGVGYTTLAWTRDGKHWVRDLEPFFEPDPNPDAWDHAHAWLDFQLPVDDEVYLYYGGYKYGHKMDRWEGRQIGLVRMPRDRYVSRDAGRDGGSLVTVPVILGGSKLTVNAKVDGCLRVRLLDEDGKPIPGFDATDCRPVKGDSLDHAVEWNAPLSQLAGRAVRVEFLMQEAQLFAVNVVE